MGGRPVWIGRGSGGWVVAAESGVPGADDGLVPVGYLEFAEDCGDVVGDGFGGDRHLPGDLGVAGDAGESFAQLTGKAPSWSHETIRAVQDRLKTAGYFAGPLDGKGGTALAPALKQWRLLGPPQKS